MENVANGASKSNQYPLAKFRMHCSTIRPNVCGATLAIAHVEPDGPQVYNLEVY
jgi:hypothetical protein